MKIEIPRTIAGLALEREEIESLDHAINVLIDLADLMTDDDKFTECVCKYFGEETIITRGDVMRACTLLEKLSNNDLELQ